MTTPVERERVYRGRVYLGGRAYVGAVGVAAGIAPTLVGFALASMAARGPSGAMWAALVGAVGVTVLALVLATRARRWLGLVGVPGAALVVVYLTTHVSAPIPGAPRFTGALPEAHPPEGMTMVRIETGVVHRSAAFAYRGGSMFDAREFAMNAILVRHPKGDVLVDTGLGADIDAQMKAFPALFRWMTAYERKRSTAEQLDAAGYDRGALAGVLLTHAHWDHASGLSGLGDVPVWVTREERGFIEEGGEVMALTRGIAGVRYETFEFSDVPYLGFARSFDVYGDGAIVVVPTPGHTPGSVAVFVTLPTGTRYALIGDLVWQLEGITERAERPWLTRRLADADPEGVRANIARVAAIHEAFPEMIVVPAHDARAFEAIPPL
ncbi:MAG: MBL fold metallo-hydrolase [Polyangiaceae bacterium]